MRRVLFLCAGILLTAPVSLAFSGDRGLGMHLSDVVDRFNETSKSKEWEVRLVREGCSKSNNQTACNFYISNGLSAIANASKDDVTLRDLSFLFTAGGDRGELVRAVATAVRMFEPTVDDAESKAVIGALFRAVGDSEDDTGKVKLRNLRLRGAIPGKMGLFIVAIDAP